MIKTTSIALFTLMAGLVSANALAAGTEAGLHASVVKEGPVTLSASVDKTMAQVADPIRFVLEVTAPQGTRVELPKLPEKLGDFEIRDSQTLRDIPAAENSHERLWVLRTTLETIMTGSVEIPSLDVHFALDEKSTTYETVRSEPIQIQIASVLEDRADPTKFRDIKGAVDVAVPVENSRAWLAWTLGGAGAAAVIALATVLLASRKRGPTPAAWALEQIDDLRRVLSDDSIDVELTYNELVDVVREFFEFQYNVPTRTRTSHELLTQAAKQVRLGEAPRRRLASFVSVADDIKFACYGVDKQQIAQAFEDARAFVLECEQHREALEKEGV